MVPFLAEIAERIRSEHPADLDRVTVVFNNRRSGIFMRHKLLNEQTSPFFLPRIVGMDSLINEWAEMEIVPKELLLFELYDIYRYQCDEDIGYRSFEEFMSLGDMMLADFSELDLYCVDASGLFSNLHDLKAIGEWNIETGQLTAFQKRYLLFYKSLYQLYSSLRDRLLSRRMAYTGMAYRYVAEHIDEILPQSGNRFYYFVGFNALSTSEEMIIRKCVANGIGTLCTDGDPYYVEDERQEAGYFLRKHRLNFPGLGEFGDHFSSGKKSVNIVSCPENVLQCKYAGSVIQQIARNTQGKGLDDTAIVFGDETLLLPMLNALPDEVRTVNVTMGLPVTDTGVHALVLKLLSLYIRHRGEMFYHQDIVEVLSDGLMVKLLGLCGLHSKLNHLLYEEHVVYADFPTLSELCLGIRVDLKPVAFLFETATPSPSVFLSQLQQLMQMLFASENVTSNLKEKEAIAVVVEVVEQLLQIQEHYQYIETLGVLQKVYIRMARKRTIAFYGQPLGGLQLLGMLETRNLDFKNLIILSANEGTLPAARDFNSLIPYNLKVAFGLPTFHEKDAVYAYNFYRLLQRAEHIHILYCTESDMMGKGEPSRFIQQVKRELVPRYPDNITYTESAVSATNATLPVHEPLHAEKSNAVLERIMTLAQRGLSPSLLNKYRVCPLKFYYENILQVEEMEQLNADLEQNEVGSCIHAVLEHIYSLDEDRHVKAETLQQALNEVDTIIDQALSSQFHYGRIHSGKNHFLKSVACMQVTGFLKSEIEYLHSVGDIEILGLEQPLRYEIPVTVGEATSIVAIAGIADRIDRTCGMVRVIDYKSGKVEEQELHVADAEPDWSKVSDKWFQLMTYEWLYHHTCHGGQPHVSGIFPLRHLHSQLLTASWEGADVITSGHLATFEEMLKQIVSELLDPRVPFLPNYGCRLCQYCPFSEICKL